MAFKVVVVTVSDTRTPDTDLTGPLYVDAIGSHLGFSVQDLIIVKDSPMDIKRVVMSLAATGDCHAILLNGGTGPAARDNTPEVVVPLLDKRLSGFEQLLLQESLKYTDFAALSRFVVGLLLDKVVMCLPGSSKGPAQMVPTIVRVLPHLLQLTSSCNTNHDQTVTGTTSPELAALVADRPRCSPYPCVSLPEARDVIFATIATEFPLMVELLPWRKCLGRVLAVDLVPQCDIPPYDASIMDGYAVLAADGPGIKQVSSVSCAGDAQSLVLQSGQCVRINTGAEVPSHVDVTIVPVEETLVVEKTPQGEEKLVEIKSTMLKPGQFIRRKGSDLAMSEAIFPQGSLCHASLMNMLAAAGLLGRKKLKMPAQVNRTIAALACFPEFVPVYGGFRVAILSTGNEILDPQQETQSTRPIFDSNRCILRNMFTPLLGDDGLIDLGIAKDSTDSLIQHFRQALDNPKCRVIVTTGGVSMGEKDLILATLIKHFSAKLHFARVWVKPGKPTCFLTVQNRWNCTVLIFCLPGNPVSCFVTAQLFVLPALKACLGYESAQRLPQTVHVSLLDEVKLDPRPDFRRARLHWLGQPSVPHAEVKVFNNQLSSCLASCLNAQLLLNLPEKTDKLVSLAAGSIVPAYLIDLFKINTSPF